MPVLERSELEASPLSDLHAVADQVGIEGFRRLRKADLIDAILGEAVEAVESGEAGGDREDAEDAPPRARRRRSTTRSRRARADASDTDASDTDERDADGRDDAPSDDGPAEESGGSRRRRRGGRGARAQDAPGGADDGDNGSSSDAARIAAGVVDVLGNGSAFLRVDPPEPSDEDVYISAAQVRRCELVSGDRVTGPVRTPRRSERYPSLVRVDTINGQSADSVSDGARYDELPLHWPGERIALDSKDPMLEAIDWLTPLGQGSRAVIVGPRSTGKSETLRRLLDVLHGRDGLDVTLVLAGARPEEIAQAQDGSVAPAAALSFAASADSQGQAVERALDTAKRIAARGGNAVVLIDSLDGLHAHVARRALAAARNLRDAGSLTVIATASEPLGGETTVIALDAAPSASGEPILDLISSGTLHPELLVGSDGAKAIAKARAKALD
jgi:transcription termination factor Rho